MKNYLLAFLAMAVATSCSKYSITGSSDLQNVDGRMLFLKTVQGDELANMDSCDVVHGKFRFHGSLDTVRVVALYMDNMPVIPVVLEDGDITVTLNSQKQYCKGTPLNDSLSAFNEKYQRLLYRMQDLSHEQSQAIMNGEDMEEVNARLEAKEQELMMEEDKLITTFITENFDNCLGPYVFEMATSSYEYPVLTPWIEALMTKATETFKNAPYVKEYMKVAHENQNIMTGVTETPPPLPTPPLTAGPTPNDLARPQSQSQPQSQPQNQE